MTSARGRLSRTFNLASLRKHLLPASAIPEAGTPSSLEAAVAIIIDPEFEHGSILFIRRTEKSGDPWSGQIAFPGGHRDSKDRNFLETATREVKEEVGIDLTNHDLLGALSPTYARNRRMLVAPFVFQLRNHVTPRPNEEVAESFWIPLSELDTIKVSKTEVYPPGGVLSEDSYVYKGHTIWGLTFRIVNMLLNKNTAPQAGVARDSSIT
jgi:8-oxo-dGTP pyrophosphatase MutT (NUDIX family)